MVDLASEEWAALAARAVPRVKEEKKEARWGCSTLRYPGFCSF